jgi:hypothetical protein
MRRAFSPATGTTGSDCQASGERVGVAEGVGESVCDGLAVGVAVNAVEGSMVGGNVAAVACAGVAAISVEMPALPVGGGLFPPAQAASQGRTRITSKLKRFFMRFRVVHP